MPEQFERHVLDRVIAFTFVIGAHPFSSGRCAWPPSGAATLLHCRRLMNARAFRTVAEDSGTAAAPPVAGRCAAADDPLVTAGNVTEVNASDKVSSEGPTIGN